MKKFLLISILLLSASAWAQPDLQWVKSIGNYNNDELISLKKDGSGNSYVIGNFIGALDIDPGAGVYNITSYQGYWSTYLLKLDSNGSFLWVKSYNGYVTAKDLEVDSVGNIYFTGTFSNTVDFNPGGVASILSTNSVYGYTDIFFCKYDPSGNLYWARKISGKYSESVRDMVVFPEGEIRIIGVFSDTVDFDPGPAAFNISSITYYNDIFICAYNTNGYFEYVKQISSQSGKWIYEMKAHNNGSLIISGYFYGLVDFDPDSTSYFAVSNYTKNFILNLNAGAEFQWFKALETYNYNGQYITVDGSDNIYCTAGYYGAIDVDPGPGNYILNASAGADIFLLKLNPQGDFLWAKSFDGTQYEYSNSISVNEEGNIFLTGTFSDTLDIDPGPDEFLLAASSQYYYSGFVARLNDAGQFVCGGKLSCTTSQWGEISKITAEPDKNNGVTLYGNYYNEIDFDPDTTAVTDTSAGYTDIFIARYGAGNCCAKSSDPYLVTASDTICEGSPAILKVEGGVLGDEAEWNWYKGGCAGQKVASGEEVNIFPEGNATYYVKAEGKCNSTNCYPVTVQVKERPKASIVTTGNYNGLALQLSANGGQYYHWFPEEFVTCDSCANTETLGYETMEYCVAVSDENGCADTACRYVVVSSIYIPDAFSPNGDGLNDIFKPVASDVERYYFAVYNRWNEKIYETDNVSSGWSGVYNNEKCEEGVYVYRVKCREKEDGEDHVYTGKFLLMR